MALPPDSPRRSTPLREPKDVPTRAANEAGISLIEVITATLIAVIAIVGLAHSFGTGRALVERYGVARVAFAAAQQTADRLAVADPAAPELTPDILHTAPFMFEGNEVGEVSWTVRWYDDAGDSLGTLDADGDTLDLRRAHIEVDWVWGESPENLELDRVLRFR